MSKNQLFNSLSTRNHQYNLIKNKQDSDFINNYDHAYKSE